MPGYFDLVIFVYTMTAMMTNDRNSHIFSYACMHQIVSNEAKWSGISAYMCFGVCLSLHGPTIIQSIQDSGHTQLVVYQTYIK